MPKYFIVKLTQRELDAVWWAVGNFTMDDDSTDAYTHMALCRAEQQLMLARQERTHRLLMTKEQVRDAIP